MRAEIAGFAPDAGPPGLHPAFRILLLLVLAGMLFRYSLAALGLVLGILLVGAARLGQGALPGILKALRRIRWLLLSIVVIYLWVAPEPSAADRPWYFPSLAEVSFALQRGGVLVVLVVAVDLLRRLTPVPQLAAGLVMLLTPLAWIGVDTQVFARRLALTLEAVPLTAERVGQAAAGRRMKRGLAGWGEAAAGLVEDIERGTTGAPATATLPRLSRPVSRDWGLLAAGVAVCIVVGRL